MDFCTEIEFFGETRPVEITWTWDDAVVIDAVEMVLIVQHFWNARGEPEVWMERRRMDVKDLLSAAQLADLQTAIGQDGIRRRAEEFHDSQLLALEERR